LKPNIGIFGASLKQTLKKAASGMGCKAAGAQEPGHNMQSGQLSGTAQRSRPPAQQFIQRFLNRRSALIQLPRSSLFP
jgi:hypothetical protein